jgi:uncharacterized protein YneF (UPF0154 family)
MENAPFTSKQYFTSLTVIHAALVLGQVLFGIISVYLTQSSQEVHDKTDLLTIILIPVLICTGIIVGNFIADNKLTKIRKELPVKTKLQEYRTILIIKYALVEGPVLFSIVQFLITANYYFLLFAAAGIIYMVYIRPTRTATMLNLKLSTEEKEQLGEPNQIID